MRRIFDALLRIFLFNTLFLESVLSLPNKSASVAKSLTGQLQRCVTPREVLRDVGRKINEESDPLGVVASLVLVRLCKQFIHQDNIGDIPLLEPSDQKALQGVIQNLCFRDWQALAASENIDSVVEGTKAAAVLSRILNDFVEPETWRPLHAKWVEFSEMNCQNENILDANHLSGLEWASACFMLNDSAWKLPPKLQKAYDDLELPFRINVACLNNLDLSVQMLESQVDFKVEEIRTQTNKIVKERRQTAWQGDDEVSPFEYSGKSMQRQPWSPIVRAIRDQLTEQTGEYYEGCLLNLYPDGGSGMRYHIDPDQGKLWGVETAVVSVGATRRFSFRRIPGLDSNRDIIAEARPHSFYVMHSDVTEMFGDCQEKFQHMVKTAESKDEKAARSSLVFKKVL